MSGGLDSTLAVRLLHDMGIEILGAHFTGPFCTCDRGNEGCMSYARIIAKELGIQFKIYSLGKEYMEIVANPPHGYGSGVNPCIDCRILLLKKAKELMDEEGASFIVTGDVVGQRPMSQLRKKIELIDRDSGLGGLILRPLSAKELPETIPEKEGIVDRTKLLGITGRRRKEQMDLAKKLDIGDYPCPAGGCLLTDKNFAARIRDLMAHEGLELATVPLLKIGRHYRLENGAKVVIGRNQAENEKLERMAKDADVLFIPEKVMGPSAILRAKDPESDQIELTATMLAAFCDGEGPVEVSYRQNSKQSTINVQHTSRDLYSSSRI